jgi:hypothetical protein
MYYSAYAQIDLHSSCRQDNLMLERKIDIHDGSFGLTSGNDNRRRVARIFKRTRRQSHNGAVSRSTRSLRSS